MLLTKDGRDFLRFLLKTSTWALHWGCAGKVFVWLMLRSSNISADSLFTNSFSSSVWICGKAYQGLSLMTNIRKRTAVKRDIIFGPLPVLEKLYGILIYIFCSKLVRLSKQECLWLTIEKTLTYCKIWPFALNYESIMFKSKIPGACTIKHLGFIFYNKWPYFVLR